MDQGDVADALSRRAAGRREGGLRGRLWRTRCKSLPEEYGGADAVPVPAPVHGRPTQKLTGPAGTGAGEALRIQGWSGRFSARAKFGLGLVVRVAVCCHY